MFPSADRTAFFIGTLMIIIGVYLDTQSEFKAIIAAGVLYVIGSMVNATK